MKILLLGKNGQVGWELQRALAPLGSWSRWIARVQPSCAEIWLTSTVSPGRFARCSLR